MNNKQETLGERLDKIVELLEEDKKKKFKMPLSVRLSKMKLRKEWAIIQLIKTNGNVQFKIVKIEDDTVKIGETYYDASAGNILKYKRYPLIIIPEWNMLPFSPRDNFDKAEEKGVLTAAQKLILTKLKTEQVKPREQLNWKVLIIIALVIGGGLLLANYMGWLH